LQGSFKQKQNESKRSSRIRPVPARQPSKQYKAKYSVDRVLSSASISEKEAYGSAILFYLMEQ
jgi:hypothetical protein